MDTLPLAVHLASTRPVQHFEPCPADRLTLGSLRTCPLTNAQSLGPEISTSEKQATGKQGDGAIFTTPLDASPSAQPAPYTHHVYRTALARYVREAGKAGYHKLACPGYHVPPRSACV